MLKKIFISFVIITIIFTQSIIYTPQKVSANSYADVPGYYEEMYAGLVTAALTVGAGAMHTHEFLVDNATSFYEGAKNAYHTLEPHAKEAFISAVNSGADTISVAGSWISHALDFYDTMPEFSEMKNPATPDGLLTQATRKNSSYTYYVNADYQVIVNGHIFESNSTMSFRLSAQGQGTHMLVDACVSSVCAPRLTFPMSEWGIHSTALDGADTIEKVFSVLSRYGISHGVTYKGLSLGEDSIYNKLLQRLREQDIPQGKLDNVALPRVIPYTPAGQRLGVGEMGLTLDGVPYNGDILWRNTTDAGLVLPTPELTIDGVPVYNLDGVYVDSTGRVIPQTEVGNITATAPAIEWIDGIPYIRTAAGTLINIITGEVIGDVVLPPEPVTGSGDFAKPKTTLNLAPLMMNAEALTTKFPFSLPWDLIRQLQVFNAEPTPPKFEVNVKEYLTLGPITVPMQFEVDLEFLDPVAQIVRWFSRIIWIIGLIFILRKILPE